MLLPSGQIEICNQAQQTGHVVAVVIGSNNLNSIIYPINLSTWVDDGGRVEG